MPRFAVRLGNYYEFDGQTAGEVVPEMQRRGNIVVSDESAYLRKKAESFCEWNGGYSCFSDRDSFARSMMKNGLLEIVD